MFLTAGTCAWHHPAVKKAKATAKRVASPAVTKAAKKVAKTAAKKAPNKAAKATKKGAKPDAKSAPRRPAPAAAATRKVGPRADLGAPVDGFFAKQPLHLRPLLDQLRALVDEAAPDASSAIKWGMAFYSAGDTMMCALAGFRAHVNLILPGAPGTYADPDGLLEGESKLGRHLKVRSLEELPDAAVRGWLKTAAARARAPQPA
jgi:hypothetical protein